MKDNIYHYIVDLPDGIKEIVLPCVDGYTIYTDARLDKAHRIKSYRHALAHIEKGDFGKYNVSEIERLRHDN